jgi:hypothetical protein
LGGLTRDCTYEFAKPTSLVGIVGSTYGLDPNNEDMIFVVMSHESWFRYDRLGLRAEVLTSLQSTYGVSKVAMFDGGGSVGMMTRRYRRAYGDGGMILQVYGPRHLGPIAGYFESCVNNFMLFDITD